MGEELMSVEDTQNTFNICMEFCGNCPSFPKINGEGLYCARGKSNADIERQGCLCSGCTIYEKYDLTGAYFCVEGRNP